MSIRLLESARMFASNVTKQPPPFALARYMATSASRSRVVASLPGSASEIPMLALANTSVPSIRKGLAKLR